MDPVSHTFICYPTFLPNRSLREVLLWVRTQVQNRIVQVINSGECGGGLGVGEVGMRCSSDSAPRRGLIGDSCLCWSFLPRWHHYVKVSGDQSWWGFPIILHHSTHSSDPGLPSGSCYRSSVSLSCLVIRVEGEAKTYHLGAASLKYG